MLKGIPRVISPQLLKVLDEMGHTDEITIGDANFPGHTYGRQVIRIDGVGAVELLDAILQLFPLDTYVDTPVALMQKVPGDSVPTPIWKEFKTVLARHDPRGVSCVEMMDKWDFYERTRVNSTAVVMTGETAQYANIILKKGVCREQG